MRKRGRRRVVGLLIPVGVGCSNRSRAPSKTCGKPPTEIFKPLSGSLGLEPFRMLLHRNVCTIAFEGRCITDVNCLSGGTRKSVSLFLAGTLYRQESIGRILGQAGGHFGRALLWLELRRDDGLFHFRVLGSASRHHNRDKSEDGCTHRPNATYTSKRIKPIATAYCPCPHPFCRLPASFNPRNPRPSPAWSSRWHSPAPPCRSQGSARPRTACAAPCGTPCSA